MQALLLLAQVSDPTLPVVPVAPVEYASWWPWIYGLGAAAAIALMGVAARYFQVRAKTSAAWAVMDRVWVSVQAVVAHVEGKLRPMMVRVLADGRVSEAERKALQAEALKLVKEALGDQVDELAGALKLRTPVAVDLVLSGLIERAHLLLPGSRSGAANSSVPPPPSIPPVNYRPG